MSGLKKPLIYDETTGEARTIAADETVDATLSNPECLSLTNGESGTVTIGAPVYCSAASTVKKAKADAAATTHVVGLVKDVTSDAGSPTNILTDGPLSASTAQWDAITGGTGGLTPGSKYFVDPATAGKLTATPPSTTGQYCAPVGRALSTTILNVKIEPVIGL